MEELNGIETLIEKAAVYGKTSFELIRLQAVDKTADKISSFTPGVVLCIIISCFLILVNIGAALWLGEVIGKTYYGFFALAGFYAVVACFFRLFFYKRTKRFFYDLMIRQMLGSKEE